jgi:hypothetical protein
MAIYALHIRRIHWLTTDILLRPMFECSKVGSRLDAFSNTCVLNLINFQGSPMILSIEIYKPGQCRHNLHGFFMNTPNNIVGSFDRRDVTNTFSCIYMPYICISIL